MQLVIYYLVQSRVIHIMEAHRWVLERTSLTIDWQTANLLPVAKRLVVSMHC